MNDQLGTIVQYFERVFDIEESEENSRFVVKHGVDSSLDHKKKVHNGLPNLLFQLAQEEVMKHRAKAFLKLYLQFCSRSKAKLKFIYSEKATKFCEIFTLLLTGNTKGKSKVKISQSFVAFSEYMNFNLA